jgi:hypothetical protein
MRGIAGRVAARWCSVVLAAATLGACTGDRLPAPARAEIRVDIRELGTPFERELLGTNVPAWLGPTTLADDAFRATTVASGATLLRMPGGSWSNLYDWYGCEVEDAESCVFPGSARPSDFAQFLRATELPGMWTVSVNDTAQSAAALVAFFNGDIDDRRVIGVDRRGRDWRTVGDWARLRAANGNPEPIRLRWWEVGNEVYGGTPESGGASCPSFGWEWVWTCDGTEYVLGDDQHDGYLAIREAMIEVDPTIEVGVVGVGDPSAWGGWGDDVIAAVGTDLDFYVVHEYGFDRSPAPGEALRRPGELWPGLVERLDRALGGRPIAVTEYNLVSTGDADTGRTMISALGALYTADSIGQLARAGVGLAAHWNLANGIMASGSDYGLVNAESYEPYPQFHALRIWSAVGATLLTFVDVGHLRVYPTRHDDGRLSIVVINTGPDWEGPALVLDRIGSGASGTIESVWAADPSDLEMSVVPVGPLQVDEGGVDLSVPPFSINLVHIIPSAAAVP